MAGSRQDLIAALGQAVRTYQRSTDALDDVVAAVLGINRTDLRCLDWLWDGPKAAGELAAGVGISAAATTAMLDRLEAKGIVRRGPDPADRRRVLVELTEATMRRVGGLYIPLVIEGGAALERHTVKELKLLIAFFRNSTEVTDRHRERIARGG